MSVLTPSGRKHYTSGIYRIAEVDDSITDAGYTTTLTLLKNVHYGFKNQFKEAVKKDMVVTSAEIQKLSPTKVKYFTGEIIDDPSINAAINRVGVMG